MFVNKIQIKFGFQFSSIRVVGFKVTDILQNIIYYNAELC